MRRARSLKLIAGLAAAGLALAACSSGSSSSTSSSAAADQSRQRRRRRLVGRRLGSRQRRRSRTPGSPRSPAMPRRCRWAWPTTSAAVATSRSTTWRPRPSIRPRPTGVTVVGELEATGGEPDSAKVDRLNQLVDGGANLILGIGFAYSGADHPGRRPRTRTSSSASSTRWSTPRTSPRWSSPPTRARSWSASAAALQTKTDNVGFIGGVKVPLIQSFQAGFDAGAKAVKPDIKITDSVPGGAG